MYQSQENKGLLKNFAENWIRVYNSLKMKNLHQMLICFFVKNIVCLDSQTVHLKDKSQLKTRLKISDPLQQKHFAYESL